MKFCIVLAAILALALATPIQHGVQDKIINYDSNINSKGYKYSFETSNGIQTDEFGHIENGHGHGHSHGHGHGHGHGHDNEHGKEEHNADLHVHGSYAWIDEKSGAKFNIKYTADERGFHPEPIRLPKH